MLLDRKSIRHLLFERASLRGRSKKQPQQCKQQTAAAGPVPFATLIAHSIGRKLFEQHLRDTYAHENILFYQACEHLRAMGVAGRSATEIHSMACDVYNNFICEDAEYEVNLDGRMRTELKLQLASGRLLSSQTYVEAERQIVNLMERDCYARFKLTDRYAAFVKQLGARF